MTLKHDFGLWFGKMLYRFRLIDFNTFFTEATKIVCDKHNLRVEVTS